MSVGAHPFRGIRSPRLASPRLSMPRERALPCRIDRVPSIDHGRPPVSKHLIISLGSVAGSRFLASSPRRNG